MFAAVIDATLANDATTKGFTMLQDGLPHWDSKTKALVSKPGTPRRWLESFRSRPLLFALTLGISAPIAMLHAADERPAANANSVTTELKPHHEDAKRLFKRWQTSARTDGKIPGALIGQIAREIDGFVRRNPQDEKARRLIALRSRLDASHDWTQADAVALLDDITAVSTAPVSWTEMPLEFAEASMVVRGKPLPVELKTAAWGQPAANGLRAAWILDPPAEKYPLGSVLKSRVLFHNIGKSMVVFKTESWHQDDKHTARSAKGGEINVSSTWFTGITPTATYRLAPGEYCEVSGHGIAIGAAAYVEEFSTGRIGAIVETKDGDDVTLSHVVDASTGGWTRPSDPKDPAELWKKVVAERVGREAPMPQAAADREQIVRHVTLDLFGEAATTEEIAAFTADNAADALAQLTARLQAKPHIEPWAGKLSTGGTRFRVTAADPEAHQAPRTASAPGRYVLGENVQLQVTQTSGDGFRTNKATILFLSPDPEGGSPNKPYEISLPDGIGFYRIVWKRGAGLIWVTRKGLIRSYDFTNWSQVKETTFEESVALEKIPKPILEALQGEDDVLPEP